MKYSVIIPVYNAAATIGRCLDSLLNQPHHNAEILLINDGSTDESGEICRRYAQMHDCVYYLEKENGGVSSARNLGLGKAVGEFILFVDSDDYVAEDYFTVVDEAMERWDPDMLIFELKCFGERNDIWQTGGFFSKDLLEIAKYVRGVARAYLYSNLMTRTFRRKIIQEQNLRFHEDLLIGEDQVFIFAYTMHVKRMVSIEKVLYNYSRESGDSLSQKTRPYLTEQLLHGSVLMRDALEKADFPNPVRRIYQEIIAWSHFRSAYSACKELLKFDLSSADRKVRIRQICDDFCNAGIAPMGFRTWLIALPVYGKMSWMVDGLSSYREYRRRQVQ